METLRAITVRQPWAWAICHAGKDVENRSWRTSYRGPLLIHAGARIERQDVAELRAGGYQVPDDAPVSAVVAVARLVDVVRASSSPWAVIGHWYWLLADVRVLDTPLPATGHQSLWTPDVELVERVTGQLTLTKSPAVFGPATD